MDLLSTYFIIIGIGGGLVLHTFVHKWRHLFQIPSLPPSTLLSPFGGPPSPCFDDVIYEQPLTASSRLSKCYVCGALMKIVDFWTWWRTTWWPVHLTWQRWRGVTLTGVKVPHNITKGHRVVVAIFVSASIQVCDTVLQLFTVGRLTEDKTQQ